MRIIDHPSKKLVFSPGKFFLLNFMKTLVFRSNMGKTTRRGRPECQVLVSNIPAGKTPENIKGLFNSEVIFINNLMSCEL